MIREPSSAAALLAWWRAALADPSLPRHEGEPQAGYYKTRLVRGGPWVPVHLYVEREVCPETGELLGPERIVADCDGKITGAERLWLHLTPITRADYDALVHRATTEPVMAATMVAVDLSATPMRPA